MATFTTRLVKKEEIAENTMAFYFEKPTNFLYTAGQYVKITLLNPPETDDEGTQRSFTLASAPHEPHLMIATRLRDTAFKRILKAMPLGNEVQMNGPMGVFTLHEEGETPGVFFAGGIGVTPFRSIILQASYKRTPHYLYLFHSNHRLEDTPFLQELVLLQDSNLTFTYIPTATKLEDSESEWYGEKGHISKQMITKYVTDLVQPMYYIAGPPGFVETIQKLLLSCGISPDRTRVEKFPGYGHN